MYAPIRPRLCKGWGGWMNGWLVGWLLAGAGKLMASHLPDALRLERCIDTHDIFRTLLFLSLLSLLPPAHPIFVSTLVLTLQSRGSPTRTAETKGKNKPERNRINNAGIPHCIHDQKPAPLPPPPSLSPARTTFYVFIFPFYVMALCSPSVTGLEAHGCGRVGRARKREKSTL